MQELQKMEEKGKKSKEGEGKEEEPYGKLKMTKWICIPQRAINETRIHIQIEQLLKVVSNGRKTFTRQMRCEIRIMVSPVKIP